MIYLDNAAHKPISNYISEHIANSLNEYFNPSSNSDISKTSKEIIESAKKTLLSIYKADSKQYDVIFTSSGCESNSLAFANCFSANEIITTPIEHASIMELCNELEDKGVYVYKTILDNNGMVDECDLINELSSGRYYMVSIQHVNNEVGITQNIRKLCKISHSYGAIFHTDAVQSFMNTQIDLSLPPNECPDLISVSGHKIGAFSGIGALIVKKWFDINPIIYGHQERGRRGGTENVIGIHSMLLAMNEINDMHDDINNHFNILYNTFIEHLTESCAEKNVRFHINDYGNKRIVSVTFDDVNAERLTIMLDAYNVVVSTGSACNTGTESYVLKELGISPKNTIRVSFSVDTTKEDVEIGARCIADCASRIIKK